MILIRCVILLLYGLCNAQIRDRAHLENLDLISAKVEALEKIVTSLENSISKLEVSGHNSHKDITSILRFRRKISNWRKKLIPKISKKMFQPSLRNQLISLIEQKHQKSRWSHKTRQVLVKRTEFKLNYFSHTVNLFFVKDKSDGCVFFGLIKIMLLVLWDKKRRNAYRNADASA